MEIKELVREAHGNSRTKGWWDGVTDPATTVPEKIALIHSEASEALEDWRNADRVKEELGLDLNEPYYQGADDVSFTPTEYRTGADGQDVEVPCKPMGFPSELADIVIRVADLAGALDIDLEQAIAEKMAYNATRPHRHGGKRA